MTWFRSKNTAAGTSTADTTVKKRFKRPSKWLLILLLVIAVFLIVSSCMRRSSTARGTDPTYTTEQVSVRSITGSLSGCGTLQPADSYTVVTLIEGEVLASDFEEGDIVEKDTVLYEIDSSDVAKNIEKAQLSLNQAQRSYASTNDTQYAKAPVSGTVYSLNVKVGDEVRQGDVVAVVRDSSVMTLKVPFPADDAAGFYIGQSAVITLDSTFETLSGTVTEISGSNIVGEGNTITRNVTILVSNPGGLTDTQAASAVINGLGCAASGTFTYRSNREVTASASGTVTAIYALEGSQVSKDQIILALGGSALENQRQTAADNLRSAELSMESTQEQLDNYTVTSPIQGTIVDKQYKTGDTVESGKALCTIYDLSYLEMTLNIDELDISSVAVGQSVQITADAMPEKAYTGVVTKVSVAGSTSDGTTSYPVTVRIDEADGLLPGMNVDAEIVVAEVSDALAVPNGAVSRGGLVLLTSDSPSAAHAAEKDAPNGYVYVAVETGVSDDRYVEILSGLQEGDTVAYTPEMNSSSFTDMFSGSPGGGDFGGGQPPQGGGPF